MKKGNNIWGKARTIILVGTLLAAGCRGNGIVQKDYTAASETPSQTSAPLPTARVLATNTYEAAPTYAIPTRPAAIPTFTATTDPCGEEISFVSNPADYRVGQIPSADPRKVVPQFITLHWDAQAGGPSGWNAEFTWKFFAFDNTITSYPDPDTGEHYNYASQFAVGTDKVIQLLSTYQHCVQRSGCARGYPYDINIEFAGVFFELDEEGVPNMKPSELNNGLELVIALMEQYPGVELVGHFDHDTFLRDGKMYHAYKSDPGTEFMAYFQDLVYKEIEKRHNAAVNTPTP
jgi:hypothetical protein